MIHRFCISNFQSIREAVELDLRIPGTTPEKPCFRRSHSRPEIRLPSVVALVGPNGSGKTALLRAIGATIHFVATSFDNARSGDIPYFLPFLASTTRTAPTRVEVEFDARWLDHGSGEAASLYRYTLELVREDPRSIIPTAVNYEALHYFPRGRPRRIMERRRGEPVYIAKAMKVRPRDDRLTSIPPNASVIATLARMGVESFAEMAEDFGNVRVIIDGPDSWMPDIDTVTHVYRDHQTLVDQISDKLQRFDLGIENMQLERLPEGKWLLAFKHHGLDTDVFLPNESAGTQHLVRELPVLRFVLDTGHLAVMDALDADFHTDLAIEILGWFRRKETNPNKAQLLCSLHNLSILDDFEKEEMFIVEKGPDGATRVHGARDVAGLRRESNLQKQYRSGIMGGLPSFG